MLKIEIKQPYKSIPKISSLELSLFSVITGKNGSGKSHLLEALASNALSEIKDNGRTLKNIQLVRFGGLMAKSDEVHNPQDLSNRLNSLWVGISIIQRMFKEHRNLRSAATQQDFLRNLDIDIENRIEVFQTIQNAIEHGVQLEDLQQSCVGQFSPIKSSSDPANIFAANLATIFNVYNKKITDNRFQNYLHKMESEPIPGLSEEEFESRFGPKPWDVVNSILSRASLNYEIAPPNNSNRDQEYKLKFIDKATRASISLADLSTGEKVLMALGLAIYRASEDGGKPDILLLDEPDAPLHPDYSRLLIDVLREEVVAKAGVRVVMTTHSPSTVAMCSDLTVYEMVRGKGRPVEITREAGVKILTRDIPNLRISTEARRQVFVESKYDVNFLERIFSALNHMRRFEFEPVFLEPHSGTTNCSDVYGIVEALAKSGSDLVRGIVDWDCRNVDGKGVFVLGGGRRYAIENYILDPFFVGLSLVRCGKRKFADFGVSARHSYSHARDMTQKEAQDIADRILADVGLELKDLIPSPLINGHTVQRPSAFLKMNGHDWEALVIEKIPELNFLTRGRREEDRLKKPVLEVVVDCCEFLPLEVRETLEKLA